MTEELLLKALSTVHEPPLGQHLVTLNMILDLQISGTHVAFTIVLTTPSCPLKDCMMNHCVKAIKEADPEAVVDVRFQSNTTTKRVDPGTVLPVVKNIIAVVSGKGGVGKSTVS